MSKRKPWQAWNNVRLLRNYRKRIKICTKRSCQHKVDSLCFICFIGKIPYRLWNPTKRSWSSYVCSYIWFTHENYIIWVCIYLMEYQFAFTHIYWAQFPNDLPSTWKIYRYKTDVERRQTLVQSQHDQSCPPTITYHFLSHVCCLYTKL